MRLSKVWPANALRSDKVSSVAINQTVSAIVEVEMLAMVVLRVIEVICGAHWRLIHTKQVAKEFIKGWVMLDSFKVITLPVHNLRQSLLRGDLFGLRVGNLNLEREISLLDETIKVSTVLCYGMNINDEIMLNTVIRLLSDVMLPHNRVDLIISNVLNMVNISSSRLVSGCNVDKRIGCNVDKRIFRRNFDLLLEDVLGLSLSNSHNNVRQSGLLLNNAVNFDLLGLAVLILELDKSFLHLLNDGFSDGSRDFYIIVSFIYIGLSLKLGGHQFELLFPLFFFSVSSRLVLVIFSKIDNEDLCVFKADPK